MKRLIQSALTALIIGATGLLGGGLDPVVINAKLIQVTSQALAKNYFYIEQEIETSSAKRALKKNIITLDDAIHKLQLKIKNPESKKIVEFMFFSIDELKSTIKQNYTAENGGLVLDYTEALYEGSGSIIKKSPFKLAPPMKNLTAMALLLERASKFYIAFRAGYTDDVNIQQAKEAVQSFQENLDTIKNFPFPGPLTNGPLRKLTKYWPVSKSFYLGIKKSDLPTIVFISTKHMKNAIRHIIDYYRTKGKVQKGI